ncbi:MAG: HlyC/CorC family transporter [Deltaproteobacteria bacterium]|nr:HlyC/CorC family transporter [Deltaproteobacteria bacterium]MBN2845609.1 HlyC/CorC family transporter [Deltaproteobacteria bacterium]
MDLSITIKLGLLAILLLLSGFFSGSEASFFSLTSLHLHKMREEKTPFHAYVQKLLGYPRKLLVTILVGNESVNIAMAALTTSILIFLIGPTGKWAAIIITTVTLIIFGEAIPKTLAVTYPIRFSSAVSLPLTFLSKVLYPLVILLEGISDFFVSISGENGLEGGRTLTEDDFKTLVDVGHEEGALEQSQKELIHRVFALADTKVSDVMTPRVDMFCLPLSMDATTMNREIIKARHSRIPIYGTDKDDLLGILSARHLLAEISKGTKRLNIKNLLQKPYFVPAEKETHSMLTDFRMRRIQMAIVVDEYGGVAGLVTLTDILESLFGEIYDEYGVREVPFFRVDDSNFIVSGMMDIEEFDEHFGLSVSMEEFDTVAGFVFHLFGKLPARGEEIEYEGYILTVEKISKTRIETITVTRREDRHEL